MQAWWTGQFGSMDPSLNRLLMKPLPATPSSTYTHRVASSSTLKTDYENSSTYSAPKQPRHVSMHCNYTYPDKQRMKNNLVNPSPKRATPASQSNDYLNLVSKNPYLESDNISLIEHYCNKSEESLVSNHDNKYSSSSDVSSIMDSIFPDFTSKTDSSTDSIRRRQTYNGPPKHYKFNGTKYPDSPETVEYREHKKLRSEYILTNSVINFFDDLQNSYSQDVQKPLIHQPVDSFFSSLKKAENMKSRKASKNESLPLDKIRISSSGKVKHSCTQCKEKLSGKVLTTDGKHYHYKCFTCFDCGRPCGKKYFSYEITIPSECDDHHVNQLTEPIVTDGDDQISITAPLRINRSSTRSSKQSAASSVSITTNAHLSTDSSHSVPTSPESSTFDHCLSAITSHSSVASHPEEVKQAYEPVLSHDQTGYGRSVITTAMPPEQKKKVVLCEFDMFRRMDLICNTCNHAIRDQLYMNLSGKKYHLNHVNCSVCHRNMQYPQGLRNSTGHTRSSLSTDAAIDGPQNKFYKNNGHIYCSQHYKQYFINLKCEFCDKDLTMEKNFKMIQMPNDPRVVYYDAECYEHLLGRG